MRYYSIRTLRVKTIILLEPRTVDDSSFTDYDYVKLDALEIK